MRRQDILLALLYIPDKPGGVSAQPVDPVRIMKGLFLFGKREGGRIPDFYSFEPYLYGPCSFQVYSDLRTLISEGDVDEIPRSPFSRWSYYRLTDQGQEKAGRVLKRLPEDLLTELEEIKRIVMSRSFLDLLRYIYERYPRYAEQSMIQFPE